MALLAVGPTLALASLATGAIVYLRSSLVILFLAPLTAVYAGAHVWAMSAVMHELNRKSKRDGSLPIGRAITRLCRVATAFDVVTTLLMLAAMTAFLLQITL